MLLAQLLNKPTTLPYFTRILYPKRWQRNFTSNELNVAMIAMDHKKERSKGNGLLLDVVQFLALLRNFI